MTALDPLELGPGREKLPPLCRIEAGFNWLMEKQLYVSALALAFLVIPIVCDVIGRTFFSFPLFGITEVEGLTLVFIGFVAMGSAGINKAHIAIDIVFSMFSKKTQWRLDCFSNMLCLVVACLLTYSTWRAGFIHNEHTGLLKLNEKPFIFITCYGLATVAIAFFFQCLHSIKERWQKGDRFFLLLSAVIIAVFFALPFMYKASSLSFSSLLIGAIGFLFLLCLLMGKIPMGMAMSFIALVGLFFLMRTPKAVFSAIGLVPFRQTSEFIFLAIPMFMLMGEMIAFAGLSKDMFDCANKWLGKLPGGLAVASVGGCAGFGAVCGDSMATVLTMSAVALQPMRNHKYDPGLATGALAAGGTLGILIPPSMGFIIFSIMTGESVGKLFVAGIVPGLLLAGIFITIIILRVMRKPELAPEKQHFSMQEKIRSLKGLLPILTIFIIVVGGIMYGLFTPGEGGAVGAAVAFIFAAARGKVTRTNIVECFYRTARMCGIIFVILIGVFIFGVFLTTSHIPLLLAEFVNDLEVNRYIVLLIVILIYVLLGCVMNIMPMMMLTLPSIYPTIQALGFDGIWFGVITVIVMEMGMITPPIGLNIYTLATVAPDIPMSTMFKGVMPFFLGMCLCVLLIILFPQIALFLPNL